jgi:uncharacterized membrane protein YozB (DUF420 family)
MIVLGFRAQAFADGRRMLSQNLLQTSWKKVGLIFGALTTVVLLLFASRVMTAGFSLRKLSVYFGLLLLIGLVLAIEIAIQRVWPSGEQRHRTLGRFTMILYCTLFITGTLTYTMLYILYPGKIG